MPVLIGRERSETATNLYVTENLSYSFRTSVLQSSFLELIIIATYFFIMVFF